MQLSCGHSFHNNCFPVKGGQTLLKCTICQSHLEEGIRENVAAFMESLQRPPAGASTEKDEDIIDIDHVEDNYSDDDVDAAVANANSRTRSVEDMCIGIQAWYRK
jgi:hypothetical protein